MPVCPAMLTWIVSFVRRQSQLETICVARTIGTVASRSRASARKPEPRK